MSRLAICIPHYGDVKAVFAQSLAMMCGHAGNAFSGELRLIFATGHLPDVRNNLARDALAFGADWLLWLDADHSFPLDALGRLLAHDLDVVGCNYPRRIGGHPTALKNGQPLETTEGVEEVDTMGLGVCLMRAAVFDALDRPWFTLEAKPDGSGHVSEDVVFFRRLRKAGIAAYVDHDLSREVGHVSETLLTNPWREHASTVRSTAGAQ